MTHPEAQKYWLNKRIMTEDYIANMMRMIKFITTKVSMAFWSGIKNV